MKAYKRERGRYREMRGREKEKYVAVIQNKLYCA